MSALISELPFREFDFHGFTGKRRIVSYGWKYDFSARQVEKVNEIPPFLLPAWLPTRSGTRLSPNINLAPRSAGTGTRQCSTILLEFRFEPPARCGSGAGWERDGYAAA